MALESPRTPMAPRKMTNKAAVDSKPGRTLPAAMEATKWTKGQSGNPAGRAKSFAGYIRTLSFEGEALVDKVWAILHAKDSPPKLQLDCIEWLADRGWGKAILNVEHSGQIDHAVNLFAGVPTEALLRLIDDVAALRAREAGVIEGEARMLETSEDDGSKQ